MTKRSYEELKAVGGKAFANAEEQYLQYRKDLARLEIAGVGTPIEKATAILLEDGKVYDGYYKFSNSQGIKHKPVEFISNTENKEKTMAYNAIKEQGEKARKAMEDSISGLKPDEKEVLKEGRNKAYQDQDNARRYDTMVKQGKKRLESLLEQMPGSVKNALKDQGVKIGGTNEKQGFLKALTDKQEAQIAKGYLGGR